LLRGVAAVLAVVAGLGAFRIAVASVLPQYVFAFRKDFLQEYTLARALAEGTDPYLPTKELALRYLGVLPREVFPHPTPHPPTTGLLLLPLALFDYSTAAAVWFVLELLCLTASVYLLARGVGARLPLWASLAVVVALTPWSPLLSELVLGQLMAPVLALLVAAWVALRSGRRALAGGLVGVAILIKPVPLPLLLLFVVIRDWQALTAAVAVVLGGYLVAGWAVGLRSLTNYFTTVLPLVSSSYGAHEWNLALSSVGWRIFVGTGSDVLPGLTAPPLIHSRPAAVLISLALPALALLLACQAVRQQDDLDRSLALMVSVSMVTMPISWGTNLLLVAIPATLVIRWLVRHQFPSRETNRTLGLAMILFVDWGRLAHLVAALAPAANQYAVARFALAQIAFIPAIGVGALAWLVSGLQSADASGQADDLRCVVERP
jgi:hypothetical protein